MRVTDPTQPIKLLLSAREAARAMSISARSLWSATQPRGPIRCVRLGARVLYSPDDLQAWIDAQKVGDA